MKNITHSLHLTGSIAVLLLVASTITSFGITNTVPYSWDFENYTIVGTNIANVTGTDGWYGDDSSGVFVSTNGTAVSSSGLPMANSNHTRFAVMTGPVTNAIAGGSGETVWIDHMVKPEHWKLDEHPSLTTDAPDAQMAYYVNTNNHLVIYHRLLEDGGGDTTTNVWTEILTKTINSGAWARVSIEMSYNDIDGFYKYYQIKLDGTLVTHTNGIVPGVDYSNTNNGSYFAMAADGASQLNSIVMQGNGSFDDFVVTTNIPEFQITYLIMSSVAPGPGEDWGTIDPLGGTNVLSGSNQTFTVSASNFWSIEKVVYVENGTTTTNITAPFDLTFYAVSNVGSVVAYFMADTTNGVPMWWMDESGLSGQSPTNDPDGDGLSTKQEWIASTDPNGDSNSVLRISRTWQAKGTNYVEWESAHVDTTLPDFGMMSCTNLVSGSFSNVGSIARSGTTNVWSEAIPPVGTFYKVEATTNAP